MKNTFLIILIFITSIALSQSVVVNELCVKNENIITDKDFHQFSDWIELHNPTSVAIDISGFYLTDDTLYKTKWQLPSNTLVLANSYLLIWADGEDTMLNDIHSNFKLSSTTEFVALYNQSLVEIDKIEYPNQYKDISYGRSLNSLVYFSQPTPYAINSTTSYNSSLREMEPIFSIESGFYSVFNQVSISTLSATDEIRYTTDGSLPTQNSTIYTQPILLTANTIIRAKTFGDILPSREVSNTYFVGIEKSLPIVSLIIEPDFLWSDTIGIFNENEIEKRVDWKRASKLQYFKDDSLRFEANNNIRLFGASAYLIPQKSFSVFANSTIKYKIFNEKDITEFDSFIMRSSSDDWSATMFRDGFVQTIVNQKMEIENQGYEPTVLFINGEYFGIFNIREKYNEDFIKSYNPTVDKDSLDFLKLNYWGYTQEVLAGSNNKYLELISYISNNNIADNAAFEGVKEYLDVDNYTNYIITQIYIGNRSYKHNIRTWRKNNTTDGFKWMIYDTDRGYMDEWREIFQLVFDSDPIFRKLLDNIDYRNHFLQQMCSHINVSFRESYVFDLIDSLQNNIKEEMPYHISRWSADGGVQSISGWYSSVNIMKTFSLNRKDTVLYRLNNKYNLFGQISLNLEKSKGGNVFIEEILIPYNDSVHTYFKNIPVTFVAKPNLGYSFVDWENISTQDTVIFTFNKDTSINARFEANCIIPSLITEDAIFLKDCSPYYIDYNITVTDSATLFCEPGVDIYFNDSVSVTVNGKLIFEGTELEPILLQNNSNQYWGGIISVGGEINLEYIDFYSGDIAIKTSSASVVYINNCDFYESDKNVLDLITFLGSDVEFYNSNIFGNIQNIKKDAIDCGYITSGFFINNKFYNVTDDCIDIGASSNNVIINYNEFYDCLSMSISIGENSIVDIYRNIISNSDGGIQVHSGAETQIINNTIHNSNIGIKAYHYDSTPNSGGMATIVNTIFSECIEDYTIQSNSQVFIKYSLSTNILHSGIGNLLDNPMFVDKINNNFNLLGQSPCIDTGDLLSDLDSDSTRADIGALFYNQAEAIDTPEYNFPVIFPNPFSDEFGVIVESGKTIFSIELYNILGEIVYYEDNINANYHKIKTMYKGLLLIKVIENDNAKSIIKVISR